jgi:excisionase family DNA binding protein
MQTIITSGITPAELIEQFRAVVRFELQQAGVGTAPATTEPEELLTVKQAAELLDVSTHTIHDWKRQGRLPFSKMGGRTYIKRAALLASLQEQQRSPKGRGRG